MLSDCKKCCVFSVPNYWVDNLSSINRFKKAKNSRRNIELVAKCIRKLDEQLIRNKIKETWKKISRYIILEIKNGILKTIKNTFNVNEEMANFISRFFLCLLAILDVLSNERLDSISCLIVINEIAIIIENGIRQLSAKWA